MQILLPPGWPRPKGYSNGIAAEGRMVFVAGLVGWDKDGVFAGNDLASQFRKTLENTVAVLAEAGARPEHVARMTWYITDRREYLENIAAIGAAYRDVMGKVYPAMAVVQVAALIEEKARVEIETTAVIPFK
jgi:enamine deaminase RidA (YjgF/YER057c/UK114 family)